jgi:cytidylate kinase
MEVNDRTRESYVRHFYRCDLRSARHYHLVLDSTALSIGAVVGIVVTAARDRGIGR